MRYIDGSIVTLGDVVEVVVPGGTAKARVVILGESYEHLDIGRDFVDWVEEEQILQRTSIVVEWIDANPLAHSDPRYAPVGNYMFSALDEFVVRIV